MQGQSMRDDIDKYGGGNRETILDGEGTLVDVGIPVSRRRDDGRRTPSRSAAANDTFKPRNTESGTGASASRRDNPTSPYKLLLSLPSTRLNIPHDVSSPNPPDTLQASLIREWAATEPSSSKKQYIVRLLEELSVMINAKLGSHGGSMVKGKRRFEVDVFGSVSWGGETGSGGDLDLVVFDREMPQGYHPSMWNTPPGEPLIPRRRRTPGPRPAFRQLPRVYKLRDLASELSELGMRGAQAILGASTPIVKFTDESHGVECDVNVNDLGGWYNSSLILHYCLIAPHVLRPMIYALKLWAAAFDLNDPSGSRGGATLSSYCLTLMAIAYLQHRRVLPNLQKNVTASVPSDPAKADDPDTIWVSWGKDQGIKAHVGFDKSPPNDWTSAEPHLTAADALRGFFSFSRRDASGHGPYYDYPNQVFSILHGGIAPRAKPYREERKAEHDMRRRMTDRGASLGEISRALDEVRERRLGEEVYMGKGDRGIQPTSWGERLLVVQDPFLWQKNCAGPMSKDGLSRFLNAIDRTHNLLMGHRDRATLQEMTHNPEPSRNLPPRRGRGRSNGFGRASPALSRDSRDKSSPLIRDSRSRRAWEA